MIQILIFLSIFFSRFNNKTTSNVVRLDKVEKSPFEQTCEKVCPYIILACIIILCVLLFIALVKHGHTLSTEANQYEHLQQIVTK